MRKGYRGGVHRRDTGTSAATRDITIRGRYQEAGAAAEERWYRRGFMVGYSLSATRWRFFVPLLLAGLSSLLAWVLPGTVRVNPEAFSVLATTIPTLAVAVFVVLERKVPDRAPTRMTNHA
jgi:hypothetical protein